MSTAFLSPMRFVLLAAVILLPQSQWAQQTLTRSQAVAAGQVSAMDVAPGDNDPMPVLPQNDGRRPALGERSPTTGTQQQPPASGGDASQGGGASTGGAVSTGGSGGSGAAGGFGATPVQGVGEQGVGGAAGASAEGASSGRGGFRGPQSGARGGSSWQRGAGANGAGANAANAGAAAQTDGATQAVGAAGVGATEEGGGPRAGGQGRGDFRGRRGASGAADEDTVQALIMRDQGLPDVLNYLELLTQKAILRSQTLPAVKITFDSVGVMSRQEAILAVESLLALNGIAVTPVGERFLKAAPITEVAKQVPQFLSGSALLLPPSQQFYTKYFKLEYLDALNEGQPIVQGLLSVAGKQEGNPVIFPKSNSIMVTDMLINLQRIEEVLQRSDVPNTGVTQLSFFQLKHVKAEDLKRRLTTLIANKDSSIAAAFSHNTTIEADERTNQLIVATHASNLPLLQQLVDGLDSDVEPQTTSEVYYIKHALATEIQTLLDAVIKGQQQAHDQTGSAQQNPGAGGSAGNTAAEVVAAIANAQAAATVAVADTKTLNFSTYVTVVADERSNAVVAYGTRADLAQIGKLIEKIDILLAQVNIQVIIAEVTLSDGVANGIEQLNIGYDTSGLVSSGGLAGWSGGTSGATYTGGESPFSFTGTLDPKRFQLIINNAKTNSNFRLLSSPVIVTTHNKEGRVDVTEQRPVITGTSTQLLDNPVTTNQVSSRDIGIKLSVKPLIGNNGIIQMEITQEVENITGFVAVNGNQQPVVARRLAQSYVSVRSGEVVVLAGLQESSLTETDNSLWLIGEIPLIGDLLNGRGKKVERRELMIFIQPFVMTNDEQISTMTNQAIDNLDNASDVRTFLEARNASDVTLEQTRASEEESLQENRPVTRPRRGGRR